MMPDRPYNLERVTRNFDPAADEVTGAPYGNGHINDTFRVVARDGGGERRYLLQRVNDYVFRDPESLMDNIRRVTTHLRKKFEAMPGRDPDRECLTLVPAADGRPFHRDEHGSTWRCYLFIDDSHTYDIVPGETMAFQGGRAFGEFQSLLTDLPGGPLNETIPRFHDMEHRLENLDRALRDDPLNRGAEMTAEIEFVRRRADEMSLITRLRKEGALPERTTHNDTKFNNVLLDSEDRALCVVDLDTVMPGTLLYDYGDSIRTCSNTVREDERDTGRVTVNIERFRGYTRGYLQQLLPVMSAAELEHMVLAARTMTFIIGVRFLTDYLAGDVYFKIRSPDHNRVRTKVQLTLCRKMEEQEERMRSIIDRLRDELA